MINILVFLFMFIVFIWTHELYTEWNEWSELIYLGIMIANLCIGI